MYNDTIKVANKIITDSDLEKIFQKMNDEILENNKLCKQETIQNERYERDYQHWTVKDFKGTFDCTVNFYDDTSIQFDNYNNFYSIFNSRIGEIKDMWVRYHYSYSIEDGRDYNFITQRINLSIYENRMDIDVSLSSADKKMDDVYQLIKDIILKAPKKYDRIIIKRNSITNKVIFGIGVIPSIIICTLLALVPQIREIYEMTYVLFPIAVVILGFMIGGIIFGSKLDRLYSPIMPDKKYAGYDSTNYKRIYKDDIDSFIKSSEIIIGKNVNNLRCRREIKDLEKKYGSYIFKEIIAILVLSLIMILIGNLI